MDAGTNGYCQRQKEYFMFYRKNLPGWERALVGRNLPSA
jgi:hypothetical protein